MPSYREKDVKSAINAYRYGDYTQICSALGILDSIAATLVGDSNSPEGNNDLAHNSHHALFCGFYDCPFLASTPCKLRPPLHPGLERVSLSSTGRDQL